MYTHSNTRTHIATLWPARESGRVNESEREVRTRAIAHHDAQ